MNQTRLESLVESLVQTLVGYVISLAAQLVIYPFYGHTFTFQQNLQIGLCFMVLSLARQYALRRWGNRYIRNIIHTVLRS
jgi:hypothetical protein